VAITSADWADPEIEYVHADGPITGTWTGAAGMAKGFREVLLSSMQDYRTSAEEYRELDDERVLVLCRVHGRGKMSGVELGEMQTRAATVFHVRDRKVRKLVVYADRGNALADLGLSAETGSDA
jgi:hypothetical protein